MKVNSETTPRNRYAEALRDPRWQKKRLHILERDKWRCSDCGSETKTLNVHHHRYKKDAMPWQYSDADLGSFCEDCHQARHKHLGHLKTAMECFTRNLPASEIENLHRAFMFNGRPLKLLMAIAKGRAIESETFKREV